MARSILSEVLMLIGLCTMVVGLWIFSRALGLLAAGALLFLLGFLTVDRTVRRPSSGG